MREECCALKDGPRGNINAKRLDNCIDVLECIPDRVAIKRVARYFIEARILDWYTFRRTCQRANAMTGAKRGPHRFKTDAAAGAKDENPGHCR